MRRFEVLVLAGAVACSGQKPAPDSATTAAPTPVAGAPAVPSTLIPPETTAGAPGRTSARRDRPAIPGAQLLPQVAPSDSIRGTISVTGTSFNRKVMVSDASRRLEVVGAQAALLRRVAGATVLLVGTVDGLNIEATRFTVRTVDGMEAIDGTVRVEAGTMVIVTADGRRTPIANPPQLLRERAGARVWVTRDPAGSIASFGFIDPPSR